MQVFSKVHRPGGTFAMAAVTLFLGGAALAHPTFPLNNPHPTGHVTKPSDLSWPPQPRGLSASRDMSEVGEQSRRQLREVERFANIEGRIANHPALKALRGKRLHRLALIETDDKTGTDTTVRRYEFFDRSSNATQVVSEHRDGRLAVAAIPAAQYQPEISDEETKEAIDLARLYFNKSGASRVQQLKGFGIMAYKPTGLGFYDGRVIYVSFHTDSDAAPEYVAWIDLTKQAVLAARKEPRP